MEDSQGHPLNKDSPCEDQLQFWREECGRFQGAFQHAMELERQNNTLSDEVLRLETELEEIKDYLRLVKEERDNLKIRLDWTMHAKKE